MSKFKFSNFMLVVMHQPLIKNRMHSCAFYCSDATMTGSRTDKLEHCEWHSFHFEHKLWRNQQQLFYFLHNQDRVVLVSVLIRIARLLQQVWVNRRSRPAPPPSSNAASWRGKWVPWPAPFSTSSVWRASCATWSSKSMGWSSMLTKTFCVAAVPTSGELEGPCQGPLGV